VTVGLSTGLGLNISGMRIQFEVTKNLKQEPNKAVIKIHNLTKDHRHQIESLPSVPVQLDAGYADAGTSTIFLGDLRTAISMREGSDIVTTLGGGDGEKKIQTARTSLSFARGTTAADVLKKLAFNLGVSVGNVNDAGTKIRVAFANTGNVFTAGTCTMGSASREMTRICRSLGLEWSIQNGKLQILEIGQALAGQAIFLDKQSGMIGSPSVDAKGIMTAHALIQPDVFPGRLLVLQGDTLQGQYRIEETHHTGDTHSSGETSWAVEMKSRKY
jgi:hypothetical protein